MSDDDKQPECVFTESHSNPGVSTVSRLPLGEIFWESDKDGGEDEEALVRPTDPRPKRRAVIHLDRGVEKRT